MRKSPKVTEVLPILYLRGLSTGDFAPALGEFFGAEAGLSASSVNRLTVAFQAEHAEWSERDLSGARLRVLLGRRGALQHPPRRGPSVLSGHRGRAPRRDQELVALADGYRESTDSWAEVLRGLKDRGLSAPVLAVGDGALGFWAALRDVFPSTREQRCWVHVSANCLDALPKRLHADAKDAIAKIYSAPSRDALEAVQAFSDEFSAFPKGVKKITGQLDVLLAFYDFPVGTGSTCAPRIRYRLTGQGRRGPREQPEGPPAGPSSGSS